MSCEILFVAGTACEAGNLSIFKKLTEPILATQCNVDYINGVEFRNGDPVATTPLRQSEFIAEKFDKIAHRQQPDLRIVAHSLGALATLEFLQRGDYTETDVRAFLISPPLPMPSDVFAHSHVRSKMTFSGGEVTMASASHEQGVIITSDYFEQVDAANINFASAVETLTENGCVKLIYSTADWNERIHSAIPTFDDQSILRVSGSHSLGDISSLDLRRLYQSIVLY